MRILPVAAILLSSSLAAAAPAFELETVSYRKQVLLADGLSVAAIALGPVLARDGSGGKLAMLGVAGYVFGAPLVHLAHGRGGAAFKSLGLRTALPMLGAIAGFKLGPNDLMCAQSESPEIGHGGTSCPGGSISGAIGGLLIGSIAAAAIDSKYLARYETMRTAPTWSAGVQHVRGGMTVGVSGGF